MGNVAVNHWDLKQFDKLLTLSRLSQYHHYTQSILLSWECAVTTPPGPLTNTNICIFDPFYLLAQKKKERLVNFISHIGTEGGEEERRGEYCWTDHLVATVTGITNRVCDTGEVQLIITTTDSVPSTQRVNLLMDWSRQNVGPGNWLWELSVERK